MSMSVIKEAKPVHREFELDRAVLFSDAVFAIAITLLIIEIKLPQMPGKMPVDNYMQLLKPFLLEFFTFAMSFLFIGTFWKWHLQLCRFLQHYDDGLIHRNLFFLFFIVTFPFSTAGIMHMGSHFMLPLYVYLFNLAGCMAGLFWISYYIFQRKPGLVVAGLHMEKELLYQRLKYNFLTMSTGFTIIAMAYFIFPENTTMQNISFFLIPVLIFFNHFRLKIKKRNTLRLVHIGDKSSSS
ncbi:TMEM175 family protein [Chitinophaga sp. HK235]|uniref:TMEM175 family protein n=1 Tax=Chitinophaga sp. HK235 TaxID=2952571 RepID=UPI001BAA8311|nr:TMEM175 family protein [Chitinophaga sp. HK235]